MLTTFSQSNLEWHDGIGHAVILVFVEESSGCELTADIHDNDVFMSYRQLQLEAAAVSRCLSLSSRELETVSSSSFLESR